MISASLSRVGEQLSLGRGGESSKCVSASAVEKRLDSISRVYVRIRVWGILPARTAISHKCMYFNERLHYLVTVTETRESVFAHA
jgi:hypothetical protein